MSLVIVGKNNMIIFIPPGSGGAWREIEKILADMPPWLFYSIFIGTPFALYLVTYVIWRLANWYFSL